MLSRLEISSEVFCTCMMHAHTTETEEVMGLLLGDVLYEHGGKVAYIWVAMPQIRTDRRKDRVEASPEQLARCSAAAEKLSEASGVRTRVIGWYHSHPHISVFPSHIDVRTQASLQLLDEAFVGLIFSTFDQDGSVQRESVTAFQAVQAGPSAHASPLNSRPEPIDSPMAHALAASIQEAKQRAHAAGQWECRPVPLSVTSSREAHKATLNDLVMLCTVLFQEEQAAFRSAQAAATDPKGTTDALTAINQAAEYQQHLTRLMERVLAPALHALQAATRQTAVVRQQLLDLRDSLSLHGVTSGAPSVRQPQGELATAMRGSAPAPRAAPESFDHEQEAPSISYIDIIDVASHRELRDADPKPQEFTSPAPVYRPPMSSSPEPGGGASQTGGANEDQAMKQSLRGAPLTVRGPVPDPFSDLLRADFGKLALGQR